MYDNLKKLANRSFSGGGSYIMSIAQWQSGLSDDMSELPKAIDDEEIATADLPPTALSRRDALVPNERKVIDHNASTPDAGASVRPICSMDSSIFSPHQAMIRNELRLFQLAISQRDIVRSGIPRSASSSLKFGVGEEDYSKSKSPWIFKRLYDWSQRAKAREIIRRVRYALESEDSEYVNGDLLNLTDKNWTCLYGDNWVVLDPSLQKRVQVVWELFHSELVFLHQRLLVARNVFKEPLKKCQVDGDFVAVEPNVLFGNLEEICQISYEFCTEFYKLLLISKEKGCFGSIRILSPLLTNFFKNSSIFHAYHAYCVNYKNALEYLENLRKTDDRFVILEKVCTNDSRCKRLQLDDFLISPLQRITRLPILIKEILKFSVDPQDVDTLQSILDSLQESLKSIDDSIKWLHNFERLQELQKQLIWPTLSELDPKAYIPDILKDTVARQFCESSIARPNRQLNYEGLLYCIENQKPCEVYLFLFNDMLLVTKIKKNTLRSKKIHPENWAGNTCKFVVQHQPVPLDSCVFCDIGPKDSKDVKHAFALLHVTQFSQLIALYTLYAPTKECKETWIRRFQDSVSTIEPRHRQQRGLSQTLTLGHPSASRSPTPSELSFKDCKSQPSNSDQRQSSASQEDSS
uniref:DH domain-containing protein n=1 Tax=Trichuris muris TaxID=70415 RepID=A0A5S6QFA4_TRIMR